MNKLEVATMMMNEGKLNWITAVEIKEMNLS